MVSMFKFSWNLRFLVLSVILYLLFILIISSQINLEEIYLYKKPENKNLTVLRIRVGFRNRIYT
jgi:hypothetical protein